MVDRQHPIDQKPELPDGYVDLKAGSKRLARKFHWAGKGHIREAALLEPMNEQSLKTFKEIFIADVSSELDDEGNHLKNVEITSLSVSEMLKLHEGTRGFISAYLKEKYADFTDGVLIIRADAVNIPTPQEMYRYTYAIVENEPDKDLQEYCRVNKVRLLFFYDFPDSVKYGIQGQCGATIRLFEPMVSMLDTGQTEDPRVFVESLRIDLGTLLEWEESLRHLYRRS